MSTLELVLLRHGESEGNRDRRFGGHGPAPLTALGRLQAAAAAAAILRDGPLDALYVSDLARAIETARPLAERSGLAPVVTPALRERSVGDWTGRSFEEVQAESPEAWAALLSRDPAWCPPGGESHLVCAARLGGFVDELLARHASGRVALVSHGLAIDHLLRRFLGVGPETVARFVFRVDNASLHRIVRRDDGLYRIASVNDVSHLAGVGVGDG